MIESGENCDVGIPSLLPGACPTSCATATLARIDYFLTIGCQYACQHFQITTPVSGDGCCLPGSNQTQDTDCPAVCGNGILERGETCDPKASCPTSCAPPPIAPVQRTPGCLLAELVGDADDCTARCVIREITACGPTDECCPSGCTSQDDADCSPVCGNTFFEFSKGEECEVNAPPLELARCPTSCDGFQPMYRGSPGQRRHLRGEVRVPADHRVASRRRLLSSGRRWQFHARCGLHARLRQWLRRAAGRGVRLGDGRLCPGAEACPSNAYCTPYILRGAGTCNAACVAMPITGCAGGDGCCPPGCTTANDSDCQLICGNGVVDDRRELRPRDHGRPPGACLRTCDDADACTVDCRLGFGRGLHAHLRPPPITGCIAERRLLPGRLLRRERRRLRPALRRRSGRRGRDLRSAQQLPHHLPGRRRSVHGRAADGRRRHLQRRLPARPDHDVLGAAGDACCPTGCTPANDCGLLKSARFRNFWKRPSLTAGEGPS